MADFCLKHTVKQIKTNKDVITIDGSAGLEKALEVLREHNLLSLPVVDAKLEGNARYLGVLNLVDIVYVTCFQPIFLLIDTDQEVAKLTSEQFAKLRTSDCFDLDCKSLVEASPSLESKTGPWLMKGDEPLSDLVNAFCTGVHRVLIVNGKDGPVFASQTDLLRYLLKNYKEPSISAILTETLGDLGLGKWALDKPSQIVTMSDQSTALTGFRRMISANEMVALPIVDASGHLVACLSASDLRGLKRENYVSLLSNVMTFLKQQSPTKNVAPPVMATLDEALLSVTNRLLERKVHRAWVVNNTSERRVVGVVSMTDIIRVFSASQRGLLRAAPIDGLFDYSRRAYNKLFAKSSLATQNLADSASAAAQTVSNTAHDVSAKLVDTARDVGSKVAVKAREMRAKVTDAATETVGVVKDMAAQMMPEAKKDENVMTLLINAPIPVVFSALESIIPKHDLGIVATHNLKESLGKKGISLPGEAKIIEVCNPKLAAEMITTEAAILTLLPCRIAVSQLPNKATRVETLRPTQLVRLFANDKLVQGAKDVEGYLEGVFQDLSQHVPLMMAS